MNNERFLSPLIGVVVILGVGSLVLWQNRSVAPPSAPTPTIGEEKTVSEDIGAAEVSMHNSAASCWSTINGNVYDLTSWIPEHPGGPEKILQLCGTDGSKKFNGKHGGQAQQEAVLAGFKIGIAAP